MPRKSLRRGRRSRPPWWFMPLVMAGLGAAAMALAVIPLIIAEGAGAAARQAMGIVMFSGLILGTAFTLFVVPMFYTFISLSDEKWAKAEAVRHAE